MTPEEEKAKAKAARQSEEAKREASSAAADARRQGQQAATAAQRAAEQAGETVKEQAARAQERVAAEGEKLAEEGKRRVGGELDAYRKAVRRAAETLEAESSTGASSILHDAAAMLDKAQSHLDQRDVRGLLRDAEDVIRTNPQAAFGGLFVLGVAAARFLRASSPSADDHDYRRVSSTSAGHRGVRPGSAVDRSTWAGSSREVTPDKPVVASAYPAVRRDDDA